MPFQEFNITDEPVLAFRHSSGHQVFELPKPEASMEALPPAGFFRVALEGLGNLIDNIETVAANNRLSDIGKAEQLDPLRASSLQRISAAAGAIEHFEREVDAMEATLLAVPSLNPGDAGEAIIDREVRDYWRGQPAEMRLKLIAEMNEGPQHARIELALLRSPIALLDHETRMVRDSWNRGRRLADPATTAKIELGRSSVEWARRGVANVVGIAMRVSSLSGQPLLRVLLDGKNEMQHRGARAFGFGEQDIARARAA